MVPSCAFLLSTTPVPWSLKGREVTFKSGLKERAKLKQQGSVWEEVVMLQLEAQAKKRYRVGMGGMFDGPYEPGHVGFLQL